MARKKAAKKKPAAPRKKAAPRTAVKSSAAKQAVRKRPVAPGRAPVSPKAAKTPARKRASLGRPKVTADEKLYLLFRDDYHARQIFEFLRVETVRELEQYAPQQIVDRLSAPIVETVQRIRVALAEQNRCLAGDGEFAVEHRERHRPGRGAGSARAT